MLSHALIVAALFGVIHGAALEHAHDDPSQVAHLSIDSSSSQPTNVKLFGLNDVLGPVMQIPYNSPALASIAETLRIGYLRHPGGTVANYWNITSGRYATSCSHSPICNMSKYVDKYPEGTFSAANFVHYLASKTGAKLPVFDLNVLTMTADTYDMQVNTLTPFCSDAECFVEIGNELHISKDYSWRFPDADVYMKLSEPLIMKLRQRLPKAKVVVPAGFVGNFMPESLAESLGLQLSEAEAKFAESWSQALAKYRHLYDAVTIHDYESDSRTKGAADNETATSILATWPQKAYGEAVAFCKKLYGNDIMILVTEYNEGLFGSQMLDRNGGPHALNMLSHVLAGVEYGSTIQSMQYHALLSVDTEGWDRESGMVRLTSFTGKQPYVNGVSQLFAHAASVAANSSTMSRVSISGGPVTPSTLPHGLGNMSCLQAVAFSSTPRHAVTIINRCNQQVTADFGPAAHSSSKYVVSYDCGPTQLGGWAEMPSVSTPFPWPGAPLHGGSAVAPSGPISVPAFSFSVVEFQDAS